MNDNTELIAEARQYVGSVLSSIPASLAATYQAGEGSDTTLGLLGRLADALEAASPPPAAKYRVVRPADDEPRVGELARTKWGSPRSAAVWRIERVEKLPNYGRRERRNLHLVSLSSARRDTRLAHNMEIVEPTE